METKTKKYPNQIKTKIPVKVITEQVVGKEGMKQVNKYQFNRQARRTMEALGRRRSSGYCIYPPSLPESRLGLLHHDTSRLHARGKCRAAAAGSIPGEGGEKFRSLNSTGGVRYPSERPDATNRDLHMASTSSPPSAALLTHKNPTPTAAAVASSSR